MALTQPQAQVLGVLAALEPTQMLRLREIHAHVNLLSEATTRDALKALTFRGLATRSPYTPAGWRLTTTGWALAAQPMYREYRPENFPAQRRDSKKIESKGET